MDFMSLARSAIRMAQGRRGGPPLVRRTGALLLLALAFGTTPAARAQSCVGKAAGDVCRPAAGSCDVAESCVALPATGPSGTALYQPADGTLYTNVAGDYTTGYGFTPSKELTVTSLGGYFNGTRTVYLFNRATGAVLASTSVTSANTWSYATIPALTLAAGTAYTVAVYLPGTGGAYRAGLTMPKVLADASIDGTCYRPSVIGEPCGYSGLIAGTNYGMVDFKYMVATPLYQPTDGTLYTDSPGDYSVGYAFTPNKALTVTSLGGFFNGTRTVSLFNRATGALLASASVTAANTWAYTAIAPVTLAAGTMYTVAVYLTGTAGAYRSGMTSMPSTLADATVHGSCYRQASTAEPCASSGLLTGANYGMANIKYIVTATSGGLACPADNLIAAGTTCRPSTGSCDPKESCTGSSAACPANGFTAAGVTCNDGALCTYNDVCNGAGSCGGTGITCGGGNACSTSSCNGTNTCEVAKVFCNDPPGECYNTLGTCSTTNGSCSYTVKVGAACGTRGTCQASGACYTPPPIATNGTGGDPNKCPVETLPAPVPIGCESCDPSKPCVVDSTAVIPAEWQTCSGYTPRKGDIIVHQAEGLTNMLVKQFGSEWTHIGVFMGPQQGSNRQDVTHLSLNLDGLSGAVLRASDLRKFLIGLSLNKDSAYCKAAKLNPSTLFDPVVFTPGVPSLHTGDILTEKDGDNTLFWENGVRERKVLVAANRAMGEDVANRMAASINQFYYSLNAVADEQKGYSRLSGTKRGGTCASSVIRAINSSNAAFGRPEVPRTLLKTDKMRDTARQLYEAVRQMVKSMPETKDAINTCKDVFCPLGTFLCPVDCNGIGWEVANGIADQIIACMLFGPGSNGCDCTRDNRKWHYANWAGAAPAAPTQDELDWVNHRMTDVEWSLDTWTSTAAAGQPVTTIYESYSYLPGDADNRLSSVDPGNYPAQYDLVKRTNVTRKYGHCATPLTLTITQSPATATYGTSITWTATTSGGTPASTQYALFRRPVGTGTEGWIPPVTAPSWQSSRYLAWTPTSADVGSWEIYAWVKDGNTPANANNHGYAAGAHAGVVQVVAPLTLTITPSPASSRYGTTITWTATANGGTPSSIQYALFRRPAGTGTEGWIPSVNSPNWQSSRYLTWTPTAADAGSWDIYAWVKDGNTPANASGYGYAAGANAGGILITADVLQAYPPKGWVDGYNTQHIWGWACDPDYPTESNRVDVYSTSWQSFGSAGAFIGSVAAINSACGGGTAHYFDFYPSGGIPSGTHFNVWSIDLPYATPGNDNRKLGGNGAIGDGTEFVIP